MNERQKIQIEQEGWSLDYQGPEALSLDPENANKAKEFLVLSGILLATLGEIRSEESKARILDALLYSLIPLGVAVATQVAIQKAREYHERPLGGEFDPAAIFGEGVME